MSIDTFTKYVAAPGYIIMRDADPEQTSGGIYISPAKGGIRWGEVVYAGEAPMDWQPTPDGDWHFAAGSRIAYMAMPEPTAPGSQPGNVITLNDETLRVIDYMHVVAYEE